MELDFELDCYRVSYRLSGSNELVVRDFTNQYKAVECFFQSFLDKDKIDVRMLKILSLCDWYFPNEDKVGD